MGQPQHRDNVRRVDFTAKASTRSAGTRSKEAEPRPRNSRSDRDQLKIVSLPEQRRRRTRRESMQNMQTLAIVIIAALLGAFIAALLLDPAL